ncbi:MAG TPA: hypothetical protein VG842_08855 [Sediminibacterium sp.]|nr:hypothetical protein [Sediminibacterium sp.]
MKKLTALLSAVPAIAWAHPGHGVTDGYTIIHYFTEPQHAVFTLGIIGLGAFIMVRELRRHKSDTE